MNTNTNYIIFNKPSSNGMGWVGPTLYHTVGRSDSRGKQEPVWLSSCVATIVVNEM